MGKQDYDVKVVEGSRTNSRDGRQLRHQARRAHERGALAHRDADCLPVDESMRHRKTIRYGIEKEFTDNFNPILRYLQKQVGRPWSKVLSEIKEMADARSLRGWHFLQHLPGFISNAQGLKHLTDYDPYFDQAEPRGLHVDAKGFLRYNPYNFKRKYVDIPQAVPAGENLWIVETLLGRFLVETLLYENGTPDQQKTWWTTTQKDWHPKFGPRPREFAQHRDRQHRALLVVSKRQLPAADV